jgi:hypothetical protein
VGAVDLVDEGVDRLDDSEDGIRVCGAQDKRLAIPFLAR